MDTTENSPVTLRLDDPRELLAYLPYRLGFWPEESAVFFSLRPDPHTPEQGWQPGLVARVDITDLADPGPGGAALRTEMLNHLRTDGAQMVFLVLYTDEPVADQARPTSPVQPGPASGIAQWWLTQGIDPDPRRIWVVSGQTYRCLQCPAPGCCPPGGHALHLIERSRIGAEMVFHGMTYAPSRSALLPQVHLAGTLRTSAVRAAARWRRRRVHTGPGRPGWLGDLAARWDQALVSPAPVSRLGANDLGALLVALEEVPIRDAVLLSAACATPVLPSVRTGADDLLAQVFSPAGMPPQRDVLARARDILHHLVAVAAQGRSAPVWSVLAWLAWYEGNGALADVCVQQCLGEDPDHRLGLLLRRAVEHGIPPGWARPTRAA